MHTLFFGGKERIISEPSKRRDKIARNFCAFFARQYKVDHLFADLFGRKENVLCDFHSCLERFQLNGLGLEVFFFFAAKQSFSDHMGEEQAILIWFIQYLVNLVEL